MGFLQGKTALITGFASERSIAAGIARAMHREGAELAFTYQGEKLAPRTAEFAKSLDSESVYPLDVSKDSDFEALTEALRNRHEGIDIVVHSIGFAPREALQGRFIEQTTREAFSIAHDISAYSFAALARATLPLMEGRQGAMLTLSYLGAERAIPRYNVMGPAKAALESTTRYLAADLGPQGIRVNAISAGPIKTLAAAGISGFRGMLSKAESMSALKRNVSADEVGNVAAFLCSDLASGITGEVTYVDAGFRVMGFAEGE
ncbi:enoyl-ACP reductase FabI [Algiphilus sp.]|uniref:enoyl-ACP reductase FabI n=1 Tax=Algiphilus sp. TaxID=1872431 RepID=UPI003B523573